MPRGQGPHAVDQHVGQRVRLRRVELGLSQEKLGEKLGITFQQVQKYERGANRISASRLYEMAAVLDVPVSYFYDGLQGPSRTPVSGPSDDADGRQSSEIINVRMMQAFRAISDTAVKRAILGLTRSVAGHDKDAEAPIESERDVA